MSNEQVETFSSEEVKELPTTSEASQDVSGELDTFDSPNVVELDTEKEESESKDGESEKEKPNIERETSKLKEKQADEDEEESPEEDESEPEGDGEEGEDSTDEEAGDDKPEDSGDKPKGKTIRIKEGDEKYDISAEATLPVKVKGKKEFVTIDELRRNYSGSKAWGEELAKVKDSQAEHAQEVEAFNAAREETKAHFSKIGDMIEDAYTNPEADPLGAMKYLLEIGGRDVLQFEKNLVNHYSKLSNQFDEMDESEIDLYWSQRENEVLKSNQATQASLNEKRTAEKQRDQNLSSVREKYGVSETEYEATKSELTDLGYDVNDVSPEQISRYTALKEPIAVAEELCSQFEEDLSDDEMDALVAGTGNTLYEYPHLSEVEALKFSAKKLGYEIETEDDLVDQLQRKSSKPKSVIDSSHADKYRAVKAQENHIESFDDFDEMTYARS